MYVDDKKIFRLIQGMLYCIDDDKNVDKCKKCTLEDDCYLITDGYDNKSVEILLEEIKRKTIK